MAPFSWSRWLRSLFRRPPSRPFRRRRPHGLGLEELETRLAPATAIWTGMAGSNWNNMGDWLRNGVPGIPQPGDDLVFPGNVAQLTIVNDLPSGESFNSLSFSDLNDLNGYVISGNAITLGDPSTPGSGNINVTALVPNVDVKLPIQFAGPGGSRQFITVGGGATLTLAGALSGTTGSELTKESQGTLVLSADNSAFTGPITVDTNGGILRITNPFALGDTTSGTTIQTNGQLQVADLEGLVVPEPLILNGAGPDNRGALLGLAGNSTWGGNITLDSDTTIGLLAGDLTIAGTIGDLVPATASPRRDPAESTSPRPIPTAARLSSTTASSTFRTAWPSVRETTSWRMASPSTRAPASSALSGLTTPPGSGSLSRTSSLPSTASGPRRCRICWSTATTAAAPSR